MTASLFAAVEMAPRDPILGLTEAFNADTRPNKVNLGVGVYFDDSGKVPLLAAVKAAEKVRLEAMPPRGYQAIEGLAAYNQSVQKLLFGEDSPLLRDGRVATIEALGGTGALKVGADYLRRLLPGASVFISDPSWENHRALFEFAGFAVQSYPYYDAATHGVDFAAMMAGLSTLPAGSIVVLHACCHNPTGADLEQGQWREVIETVGERGLVPFIDIAYQGFADGTEEDALAVRLFAASGLSFLVASSFSKSFALYGERVGALSVVTAHRDEAARVLSQIKRIVRTNYSNPPTHGGAIVAAVLGRADWFALWQEELGTMRARILDVRARLVTILAARGCSQDFSFVARQRGMFSYTGLTAAQVDHLREAYGIYAVSTGRINVAALNSRNIDYVAEAIASL